MKAGWIEVGDAVMVAGVGRALVIKRAGVCQDCGGAHPAWRCVFVGPIEAIACETMLTPLAPGRPLGCHHVMGGAA